MSTDILSSRHHVCSLGSAHFGMCVLPGKSSFLMYVLSGECSLSCVLPDKSSFCHVCFLVCFPMFSCGLSEKSSCCHTCSLLLSLCHPCPSCCAHFTMFALRCPCFIVCVILHVFALSYMRLLALTGLFPVVPLSFFLGICLLGWRRNG